MSTELSKLKEQTKTMLSGNKRVILLAEMSLSNVCTCVCVMDVKRDVKEKECKEKEPGQSGERILALW